MTMIVTSGVGFIGAKFIDYLTVAINHVRPTNLLNLSQNTTTIKQKRMIRSVSI